MQQVQNTRATVVNAHTESDCGRFSPADKAASTSSRMGLSPRGRLTATVLELAEQPAESSAPLAGLRETLDDVLALDCRFPFHLAAFVKEKVGCSRVAVALLVEAANRVGESRRRAGRNAALPFALRPLVRRIVHSQGEAAYAMAYQVRNFGWAMPTPLRTALTDVLAQSNGEADADPEHSRMPVMRALQPLLVSA